MLAQSQLSVEASFSTRAHMLRVRDSHQPHPCVV